MERIDVNPIIRKTEATYYSEPIPKPNLATIFVRQDYQIAKFEEEYGFGPKTNPMTPIFIQELGRMFRKLDKGDPNKITVQDMASLDRFNAGVDMARQCFENYNPEDTYLDGIKLLDQYAFKGLLGLTQYINFDTYHGDRWCEDSNSPIGTNPDGNTISYSHLKAIFNMATLQVSLLDRDLFRQLTQGMRVPRVSRYGDLLRHQARNIITNSQLHLLPVTSLDDLLLLDRKTRISNLLKNDETRNRDYNTILYSKSYLATRHILDPTALTIEMEKGYSPKSSPELTISTQRLDNSFVLTRNYFDHLSLIDANARGLVLSTFSIMNHLRKKNLNVVYLQEPDMANQIQYQAMQDAILCTQILRPYGMGWLCKVSFF